MVLAQFILLAGVGLSAAQIYLHKLDTYYLKCYDANFTEQVCSVPHLSPPEMSAYDIKHHMIYTVGSAHLHVIDAANPSKLAEISVVHETGREFTSVKVCENHVFTAEAELNEPFVGRLDIYRTVPSGSRNVDMSQRKVISIPVGVIPDSIAVSRDCKLIVIALEGEAYEDAKSGEIIDPKGGVGIAYFPNGISNRPNSYSYTELNFTKFDSRTEDLVNRGVRFVYRENGNTLSRDLEPESVIMNDDDSKAFVVLQENNAMAILDLTDRNNVDITDIIPLGYKDWSKSGFDASDKDSGINIMPHPVFGMYQPDGLDFRRICGIPYIFTANEGDSKDYDKWSEEKRGKDFILDGDIKDGDGIDFISDLNDTAILGRLTFTTDEGLFKPTGVYRRLYAFGARSFSIFRATDMQIVFDSGDSVARSHEKFFPDLFNGNIRNPTDIPKDFADTRSDNKGPETESITLAEVHNKIVIFVGNERPGTINIYSLTNRKVKCAPQFESVNYGGKIIKGQTWIEAYRNRTIGDIDPESLVFVPANKNPSGEAILIVTGHHSGTVSVYAVRSKALCGKTAYNAQKQICCRGAVRSTCGGKTRCCGRSSYNPTTHICCDGKVNSKRRGRIRCCGKRSYNPHTHEC